MSTPGDRLKHAREAAGFETAVDAANAMGFVAPSTYTQHENGLRGFPAKKADRYAEFFRTSAEWLLYGRKPKIAKAEGLVPVVGRVGANADGEVLMANGDSPNAFAPRPPGGGEGNVALEVVGHSMRGVADDGALIYFRDQRTPPSPDMLGEIVVVETDGDEVLVKYLRRGSRKGVYDLESLSGPPKKDVRLRWAAHITAIIPPREARRIIIRTGEAA
jgi:SOS-response transcriptional repressor LexA